VKTLAEVHEDALALRELTGWGLERCMVEAQRRGRQAQVVGMVGKLGESMRGVGEAAVRASRQLDTWRQAWETQP
jgi:hypothetical protein